MVNTVYSIGYSGFSRQELILTLQKYGVSLLVDVRSSPFSNYYQDYNKDVLESALKASGIFYRNYADEFGARQENKIYYCKDGYLDFDVFSRSEPFLRGVDKLCKSMEKNYKFALMCAEKDPIHCHRAILVARAFYERGYHVIHLLPDGQTTTQEEIGRRLVEKYFPDRDQMTLFETIQDDDALLEAAYKKQNAEIGYRMEELA